MLNSIAREVKLSRAVRLDRVCDLTGASRATVWRWTKHDPTFPQRFRLSAAVTVWDENEVLTWIEAKKAVRGAR
jgi:predicted DNA-binding transcriptional regulator AlpA